MEGDLATICVDESNAAGVYDSDQSDHDPLPDRALAEDVVTLLVWVHHIVEVRALLRYVNAGACGLECYGYRYVFHFSENFIEFNIS